MRIGSSGVTNSIVPYEKHSMATLHSTLPFFQLISAVHVYGACRRSRNRYRYLP